MKLPVDSSIARILLAILAAFGGLAAAAAPADAPKGAVPPKKDSPQWIVVTAPALAKEIAPLCDRRREQGLNVVVVPTTDVLTPAQIRGGDGTPLKQHLHKLYAQTTQPSYVLLVGAATLPQQPGEERFAVPMLRGTIGRMKGRPTDNGYGCTSDDLLPTVAVGRLPVRTVEEARQVVQKTLSFEQDRGAGPWRNRFTLLVGNPGGSSLIETKFAAWYVQSVAAARLPKLPASWTSRIIIHSSLSPYCVPDGQLRETALKYLEEGQLFTFYLGHSGAAGFWSGGARFLGRDDWANLKTPHGQGVFFSCGCFGCQLEGIDGEGYAFAAIRNATGPIAVIGAHGESYAAMGQLAIDGLLELTATADEPRRLADFWLATKAGIAKGPMDAVTFYLCDQADGSRGATPQAVQRQEHLEMWTLLGDPAMQMPILPREIELTVAGPVTAGGEITVTGKLPARLAEATVDVTLERPLGSAPPDLEPVSEEPGEARDQALHANHERANRLIVADGTAQAVDGHFECRLSLPENVTLPKLVIRATASSETEMAIGATTVSAN